MSPHFYIAKQLYKGQSLARIQMNLVCRKFTLHGKVVDVGGGRRPDYFEHFTRHGDVQVDMVDGSESGIDFEQDALPYASGSVDTVILCNVLEHVYRYDHLLREVRRALVPSGTLIGFVPFWTGYHPDPHDYFRYTHEALARMLSDAGFGNVHIRTVGDGPVLANFNTIVLSVPRFLRPLLYFWYAGWDALFLVLRPGSRARNPLGYLFTAAV